MIRRLRPRPLKDLTEDERQAFFADMHARTAAMLAERAVPKSAQQATAPDQQSDP